VRAALVVAIVAAIVVVLGLFPSAVRIAGLAVMVAAAIITSPGRLGPGGGWWWMMSAGVALSVAGALIAQAASGLGGVIALLGGMTVVVFGAIGYPAREEEN
jgi:hypothetical protein